MLSNLNHFQSKETAKGGLSCVKILAPKFLYVCGPLQELWFYWYPYYVLARLFIPCKDSQKSIVFLVPKREKEQSRFRHAVKA